MQMFNLVNMIQGIKIVTIVLFTTQAPLYYAKHVQVTRVLFRVHCVILKLDKAY